METSSFLLWYIWEQFIVGLIGYLSLTEGLHLRCIYVRQPQQLATCAYEVKHENSPADAMGANRPCPQNEDIMKCGNTCFFSRKILSLCIRMSLLQHTVNPWPVLSVLLLRCHANMCRLCRYSIWSGCLALRCLYNLLPYGQFRDH